MSMRFSTILWILMLLASFVASRAQPIDRATKLLTPFFAGPIPTKWPPKDGPNNPILSDLLRSSKDPIVLLSSDSARASLLVGASRSGLGMLFPLPIEGYRMRLAEGAGNTLWIGGTNKVTTTIASTPRSSAFLAKVDRSGHFYWEHEFGGQTQKTIQDIVNLSTGDVVVSGKDDDRTWLARISSDGNIIWERHVGLGKASAIATIDGVLLLATMDSGPGDIAYREDVVIWSFNERGELLDRRVIREGLNRSVNNSAAEIRIERAQDSIYLFSAWLDRKDFKLPEIVKLDAQKDTLWRKEIQIQRGRQTLFNLPAETVLSNGDVLISCCVGTDGLFLMRLNAKNGASTQIEMRMSVAPQYCPANWAPVRYIKEKSRDIIWLFGSPPSDVGAAACGWIGEIFAPDVE
jgi:hypothetical protein